MKTAKTDITAPSHDPIEMPAEGGHEDRRAQTTTQRRIAAAADAYSSRTLQRVANTSAVVQRAPLVKVVSPKTVGMLLAKDDDALNRPYVVRRQGLPEGYHATIFPVLTEEQIQIFISKGLGEIPDHDKIEFKEFNITEDSDRRYHFYFTDDGKIIWKGTKKEAPTASDSWLGAIKAAVYIYGLIGVGATVDGLIEHLHKDHGRKNPLGDDDKWFKAQERQKQEESEKLNEKILKEKGRFGGLVPRIVQRPSLAPTKKQPSKPQVQSTVNTNTPPVFETTSSSQPQPMEGVTTGPPQQGPTQGPVLGPIQGPQPQQQGNDVKSRILRNIEDNANNIAASLPDSMGQRKAEWQQYIQTYVDTLKIQFDVLYHGWDLEEQGDNIVYAHYDRLLSYLRG